MDITWRVLWNVRLPLIAGGILCALTGLASFAAAQDLPATNLPPSTPDKSATDKSSTDKSTTDELPPVLTTPGAGPSLPTNFPPTATPPTSTAPPTSQLPYSTGPSPQLPGETPGFNLPGVPSSPSILPGTPTDNMTTPGVTTPQTQANPSQSGEETIDEKDLARATELFGKQQYDDAIRITGEIINRNPGYFNAYGLRGLAFRRQEKIDDAIEAYSIGIRILELVGHQRTLTPDENNGTLQWLRGIAWIYRGEPAIALADFQEAAALNDRDSRYLLWQAYALVKLSDLRGATDLYSQALTVEKRQNDTKLFAALVNRGLAFLALGEYEHAITDFNEVLRDHPADGATYFRRGVAQGRQGNLRAAIDSYDQAIRLDPKNANAYFNRSRLYAALGQNDKAQADEKEAVAIDPEIRQRAASSATLQDGTIKPGLAAPVPPGSASRPVARR